MTTHGPGRVPGVRRLTDAIDRLEGTGVAVSAAHGPDGGQGGSGDSVPSWTLTATPWTDEDAWRDLQDRLADMTRQRDEAVKAFQRERARVARVEAVAQEYEDLERQEGYGGEPWGTTAACIREALADRPADV